MPQDTLSENRALNIYLILLEPTKFEIDIFKMLISRLPTDVRIVPKLILNLNTYELNLNILASDGIIN